MKIFDMHIHVGNENVDKEYLFDKMAEAGVYGGGIISAAPFESAADIYKLEFNERLDNALKWQDGKRLFSFLWIHPDEVQIEEKIAVAAKAGISGFKIICDNDHVYSQKCLNALDAIEKAQKPVLFHTGILWSGTDTSRYNRPADWETLLNFKSIKFSMGHCSWPWHDECIAVYGKLLHHYNHHISSEMFFDITPGTPKIYRRDLLTKLFTVGYDVENNIMFGTDSLTNDYTPAWVAGWLSEDKKIMDDLGISTEVREKIYEKNLMRFVQMRDTEHRTLQINK